MSKITYILSHPIQYYSPLFKQLAKEVDLEVLYFSDSSIQGGMDKGFGTVIKWDVPLLSGYKYKFIKNYSKSKTVSNRFFDLINPGLIGQLRKSDARVVIVSGWSYSSYILAIVTAAFLGKKVWLRAENPLHHELTKSRKILALKKLILKFFLFKLIDKFLYIGSQNKEFFKFYGAKDQQLVYTPYSVDNDFFDKEFIAYKNDRAGLKAELNIDADKKIILFSGKYNDQKRPLDLLKAFNNINHNDFLLIFVGEGALRLEMEAFVKENNLANNVLLTGFINQSSISKYYCIADVFVMCSGQSETWGLSVNEAMNFMLPVIVSDRCGCSYDLVQNGVNGFTFKEGDVDSLGKHISFMLNNDKFRKTAGEASKRIIKSYSIPVVAANIANASSQQI